MDLKYNQLRREYMIIEHSIPLIEGICDIIKNEYKEKAARLWTEFSNNPDINHAVEYLDAVSLFDYDLYEDEGIKILIDVTEKVLHIVESIQHIEIEERCVSTLLHFVRGLNINLISNSGTGRSSEEIKKLCALIENIKVYINKGDDDTLRAILISMKYYLIMMYISDNGDDLLGYWGRLQLIYHEKKSRSTTKLLMEAAGLLYRDDIDMPILESNIRLLKQALDDCTQNNDAQEDIIISEIAEKYIEVLSKLYEHQLDVNSAKKYTYEAIDIYKQYQPLCAENLLYILRQYMLMDYDKALEPIYKDIYYQNEQNNADSNHLDCSPYIKKLVTSEPEIIYHYTDLYALKSIVENNTLWATNTKFVNDIEERRYIANVLDLLLPPNSSTDMISLFDTIKHEIQNYSDTYSYRGEIHDIIRKHSTDAYIISFSVNQDSLPLWSGYAQKQGLNIGFNRQKLRSDIYNAFDGEANDVLCGKVLYVNNQAGNDNLQILQTMICEICDDCLQRNIDAELMNSILASHIMYIRNFVKSESMKSEEEYRMVIIPKTTESNVRIRVKDDMLIPYIEYSENIQEAIKCVTIGPTNKNEMLAEGLKYLLKRYCRNLDKDYVIKSGISLRY